MAIEARGTIIATCFVPKPEAMMAKGPIKMLYVIGKDFAGFELEALWDDGAFGLRHWHDFSLIAVVADHAWMRHGQHVQAPLSRQRPAVRTGRTACRERLDREYQKTSA